MGTTSLRSLQNWSATFYPSKQSMTLCSGKRSVSPLVSALPKHIPWYRHWCTALHPQTSTWSSTKACHKDSRFSSSFESDCGRKCGQTNLMSPEKHSSRHVWFGLRYVTLKVNARACQNSSSSINSERDRCADRKATTSWGSRKCKIESKISADKVWNIKSEKRTIILQKRASWGFKQTVVSPYLFCTSFSDRNFQALCRTEQTACPSLHWTGTHLMT